MRLKSRFKTSEIELARKKYGRTFRPPSETTEINASAGGGTAEILLNADKKTGEVISTAVKTTEIFIESGENLFYLHCYNCHFDHSRLKIAPELAGRNFWIKYNDSKDNSIIKVVRKGRRTKDADMPAYGIERLNEKEAEAIVTYLESMLQPVNGDVY